MMRWIYLWRFRLRAIFRRAAVEREMEAEMADHLATETEDLTRRGISAGQAEKRARETMGRLDILKEECRDARGVTWWDHFRQDAVFASRLLAKNRTFSVMALATMALAIGSTSAVFSVVDAVLVRPLPYREPERLFTVEGLETQGPFDVMRAGSRVADYAAHQNVRPLNFMSPGQPLPERIKGSEISANLFDVLGVKPLVGRSFTQGEDHVGRARVAILSYQFWKQQYNGRPDILSRTIVLDDQSYEITGVMPREFHFPSPEAQVWIPIVLDPRSAGDYWGKGGTGIVGRLRAGAALEDARTELRVQVPRIRAMFPWQMPDAWPGDLQLRKLRDAMVQDARLRQWMLAVAVGLMLLIAVVNVANLMTGQTTARAHEIAVRTSLGATPGRLARQLVTEALVLTILGGLLGVVLGYGQLRLLLRFLPADTPRLTEIAMDGRVLAFAAAVSVLSGLLIGFWPAWRAWRQQAPIHSVDSGRSFTAGVGGVRADSLLVTVEAGFVTLLLIASALLLRSFWTMLQVDPGFRVESVVTAELTANPSAVRSRVQQAALWEQIRQKLAAYPGVRGVAAMNVRPLTPQVTVFAAAIEDHPRPPQAPQYVLWTTAISPEYLDVLDIKLLAGRGFSDSDRANSAPVVLVSRSTAQRFWPGGNPIGKALKPVSDKQWRTIVGVIGDVKSFSLAGLPSWIDGEVYMPMSQSLSTPREPMTIAVHLDGNPAAFEQAITNLVQEACRTCAVSKVARMDRVLADSVAQPRSTAWLVGSFALLALGMAAAGIYGVVNHGVVRRTRELGVRIALGAQRHTVAALVIGASLRGVALGSFIGLLVAWLAAQAIDKLLFGVTPHDPLAFAAAPSILLCIAVIASSVPAIRAVRIDPAECLREG